MCVCVGVVTCVCVCTGSTQVRSIRILALNATQRNVDRHTNLDNIPHCTPSSRIDAVHAAVQSTGQAAPAEVVRRPSGQGEEEDHAGADHHDSGAQAEDVLVPGVEGLQDRVQEVRPLCVCHSIKWSLEFLKFYESNQMYSPSL